MKKILAFAFLLFPLINCVAQEFSKMNTCIIENGQLKNIEVDYNSRTREQSLLVGGVRKKIDEVYPLEGKDYAAGKDWFINYLPVTYLGKPYVKYGLPRVLNVTELEKSGSFNGVGVYTEAGRTGMAEVIYIPVRRGCEFQPYQIDCKTIYIEQQENITPVSMGFVATIAGETEKINYSWESQGISIVKGQGSGNITVDTRNKKNEDEFRLTLYASTSKKCWIASASFVVEKPSQPAANKWGKAEREVFMKECVPGTKMEQAKARAYCSCVLEKIIKVHPDPLTAQKEMKKESLDTWARECLSGL